ncbi:MULTISPECIES: hypothetical protein [unclassified Arthrobacter]|uniref:hypothetical protein n=1 Tax=unclassified Arthrobacter TaxID=235627 RepID=UPI0027E31B87|nr:hypothetical protein [Arthrobacter sp. MAHUQ-56]
MISRNSPYAEQRRAELARRLRVLLDVVVAEGGRPYEFADIQSALAARGVKLSRARWYYMRDGDGPLVTDAVLLEALAEFFGVPAAYLTDPGSEMPARVEAQLELLRVMRKNQVKSFALRALGEVYDAESVRSLARLIDTALDDEK